MHQCFKKVKIVEKPDEELEKLYNKRRVLRTRTDEASIKELDEVDTELSEKYSEKMFKKIMGEIEGKSDCEEGGSNVGSLWKLNKKLSPRYNDPPTAMVNTEGKLLTNDKEVLNEAVNHYKEVFKDKPINEEYKQHKTDRERLCMKRLEESKQNKTNPWSEDDVISVLKNLKTRKSRDPYEMPNELFHPNVAGGDLITAVTKLMNRIKEEYIYPSSMEICNVTNLYKNKGQQSNFNSYRGIFRTTVLRSIMDKLLYNEEYEGIDSNLTDGNVGSRKRRNVRDNLFVINAITNENKQTGEPVDIDVYDVKKCFDSLWLAECINDLYDAGFKSDKLPLLYISNRNANIAIKTSNGTTERFNISDRVMQGGVWGGLKCTTTMDQLCKKIYKDDKLQYQYRGSVSVPPLEMVDDIITASKCGSTAIALNTAVNTFIEQKKLKLSEEKCSQIHIGNKQSKLNCPQHKVHGNPMKESNQEKYLGDFITNNANSKATIEGRKSRGYAILSRISALLRDIPLGRRRTRIGLELRSAWFINGCFFNSEVWSGFSDNDLKDLEIIDHKIMRLIIGAQAKVPTEMLYLETAQLEIKYVITIRRLMYLYTLVTREEDELTNKIYQSMKANPLKGDWIHLVNEDLKLINMPVEIESSIKQMSKKDFKQIVQAKVRKAAFEKLKLAKLGHSKVNNISHIGLMKPQEYITSNLLSNKQSSLLFNLRSKCVNEFKSNFKFGGQQLNCELCLVNDDSQEHALSCQSLNKYLSLEQNEELKSVNYEDLFGAVEDQLRITKVYENIIAIRKRLRAAPRPGLPGLHSGPSG
jgi:hypothetical protein